MGGFFFILGSSSDKATVWPTLHKDRDQRQRSDCNSGMGMGVMATQVIHRQGDIRMFEDEWREAHRRYCFGVGLLEEGQGRGSPYQGSHCGGRMRWSSCILRRGSLSGELFARRPVLRR